MADKKENLIEEEVKETKKATRKKKSDEEGAKSTAKKHRLFRKSLWKNAGEYLQ